MPQAKPVCGFGLATKGGIPIAEIAPATEKLTSKDTHFGLNGNMFDAFGDYNDCILLGPRGIDMSNRGGTVAEFLWEEYKDKSTSEDLSGFLSFYNDFGQTRLIKKKKFSENARIIVEKESVEIESQPKYKTEATHKTIDSLVVPKPWQEGTKAQAGTRWSKVALEKTLHDGGTVHFHLDGMGNVSDIILGKGDASHNVTSRELRYVYRNWTRGTKPFLGKTFFYNGYIGSRKSYQAMQVYPPW